VITSTSGPPTNHFFMPGRGLLPPVYIHLAGAETLKNGLPLVIGWLPPLTFALAIAILCTSPRRGRSRRMIAAAGFVSLLAGPILLETDAILVDIVPGLFLLSVVSLFVGSGRLWAAYRKRGNVNGVSGLPNLDALRDQSEVGESTLIVVRIRNYAQICTALPAEQEQVLALEIARRLTFGGAMDRLFHGDEGIFAWLVPAPAASWVQEQLDALHAIFRTPVVVAGAQFDLTVTFGFETAPDRSPANRLGSALVAADEAAAEGRKWKKYDAAQLKEAPWRLSMLSQLDTAMGSGDLWVAYQPKLDLASRTITGAEALVRWTHPEKGPISPLEFISVAEQSGRIGDLTSFVLERAIRAAAFVVRQHPLFGVSVNISAKLLDEPGLEMVVARLLHRYRLPPGRLTLEVTETAALAGGDSLEPLDRLRSMGVQISIDDYGTGLSTLEYLRKIPATEIKIDQSFVQSIHKSQSDRLMVHSTIQLAHSLRQKAVAEGVEDAHTLEALAAMGCDVAQGYFIGKPMPFRQLVRTLRSRPEMRAA
jgi:EAL domain-containing protein (putative c-di-GMP-specific phosphodiesterase class I)